MNKSNNNRPQPIDLSSRRSREIMDQIEQMNPMTETMETNDANHNISPTSEKAVGDKLSTRINNIGPEMVKHLELNSNVTLFSNNKETSLESNDEESKDVLSQ